MRVTLGWARCADNVADILRRGAWYPIVEESTDGHVVVEVRQQRVRLPRGDVTIRTEVPDHWSVVARTGVLRKLCVYRDMAGARHRTCPCPPLLIFGVPH